MKSYRGYYIDNVIYHKEAEIDEHIKQSRIDSYKNYTELFAITKNIAIIDELDRLSNILINEYGFTWESLEELEIQTLKNMK